MLTFQPLDLPHIQGKAAHHYILDAGKSLLGLLHDGELHVFRYAEGFAPVCRFALPTDVKAQYTLSKDAMQLIGATSDCIWEIEAEERGGRRRQSYVFEDADNAEVKAAQFSSSGEILWVGREYSINDTPYDPLNAWHELLAFDGATLTLLGRVPLTGEVDGAHDIQCHPSQNIVGVEVVCGQDGSWLSFAQVERGRLERRAEIIARPDHPFICAGFAPDGNALMIVDEDTAREYSWPRVEIIAEALADAQQNVWERMAPSEENDEAEADTQQEAGDDWTVFGWGGAYVGACFVASIFREVDEGLLRVFDCPSLHNAADVQIATIAGEEVWRVDRLGDDVLLVQNKHGLFAWRVTNESGSQVRMPL